MYIKANNQKVHYLFKLLLVCLTIAHGTALALQLHGPGAAQGGADERVADDGLLLTAAGETLVVVGRPARGVSVVLVLKETRVRVLFQLLGVFHQNLHRLGPLCVPPVPQFTVIGHMHLWK